MVKPAKNSTFVDLLWLHQFVYSLPIPEHREAIMPQFRRLLRLYVVSVTLCNLLCSPNVVAENSIVVATEIWAPVFTTDRGDGLYQKIVEQAFSPTPVEFIYTSYDRSKHMVESGKADLWLGAYDKEEPWALFPHQAFDADIVVAVYKASRFTCDTLTQRHPIDAVWLKSYRYELYYPDSFDNYYEIQDFETGLGMLIGERAHLFLHDFYTVQEGLAAYPEMAKQLAYCKFGQLPLYPGFQHSIKGEHLQALWDKGISRMKESGELQSIYTSYDVEYLLTDEIDAH